jgi:hypothetical protein
VEVFARIYLFIVLREVCLDLPGIFFAYRVGADFSATITSLYGNGSLDEGRSDGYIDSRNGDVTDVFRDMMKSVIEVIY